MDYRWLVFNILQVVSVQCTTDDYISVHSDGYCSVHYRWLHFSARRKAMSSALQMASIQCITDGYYSVISVL